MKKGQFYNSKLTFSVLYKFFLFSMVFNISTKIKGATLELETVVNANQESTGDLYSGRIHSDEHTIVYDDQRTIKQDGKDVIISIYNEEKGRKKNYVSQNEDRSRAASILDRKSFTIDMNKDIYNYCLLLYLKGGFKSLNKFKLAEILSYTFFVSAVQMGGLFYAYRYLLDVVVDEFSNVDATISCDSLFSESSCHITDVFSLVKADGNSDITSLVGSLMALPYIYTSIAQVLKLSVLSGKEMKKDKGFMEILKVAVPINTLISVQTFLNIATIRLIIRSLRSFSSPQDIIASSIGFLVLNEIDDKMYELFESDKDLAEGKEDMFTIKIEKEEMKGLLIRNESMLRFSNLFNFGTSFVRMISLTQGYTHVKYHAIYVLCLSIIPFCNFLSISFRYFKK